MSDEPTTPQQLHVPPVAHIHAPHSDIDATYLDVDDDINTADALQGTIYSNTTDSSNPVPTGQQGTGYNSSNYNRTVSSVNNNLLNSHTDFSDIQTLNSSDDGNWDETAQYTHDFKSYCARYKQEVAILCLSYIACLIMLILFFVGIGLKSNVMILIFAVVFCLIAAASGYFSFKFWKCYKKRAPFAFQG